MYQRILVPLDGSEQAESALPLACTLASINDAEINLMRVVEYPYEMYSRCDSYTLADPGGPKRCGPRKSLSVVKQKTT